MWPLGEDGWRISMLFETPVNPLQMKSSLNELKIIAFLRNHILSLNINCSIKSIDFIATQYAQSIKR